MTEETATATATATAGPRRPEASSGDVPVPRRGVWDRVREPLLIALTFVVLVLIWWFASVHWIKPVWISSPSLVAHRFVDTWKDGTLVANTWATFQEAILGLAAGTVLGLVVALVLDRLRLVARVLDPYLLAGYSLPRIALAPFFVLWLGIGLASKVTLVTSVIFFVVLFNVRQGLGTVDPDLRDALKSMRAGTRTVARHLLYPTVLPWLVSAIKIGVGMALVSAIVGEIVGSTKGLGWYITNSLNQFDITGGVTALLVVVFLAMVMYYVLDLVERRLFRWRGEDPAGRTDPA
jgi:NitT/TauT family transport system permease protein